MKLDIDELIFMFIDEEDAFSGWWESVKDRCGPGGDEYDFAKAAWMRKTVLNKNEKET